MLIGEVKLMLYIFREKCLPLFLILKEYLFSSSKTARKQAVCSLAKLCWLYKAFSSVINAVFPRGSQCPKAGLLCLSAWCLK